MTVTETIFYTDVQSFITDYKEHTYAVCCGDNTRNFSTGTVYSNPYDEVGLAGIRPHEFLQMYNKRVNYQTLYADAMAPQGFDAAWAVALALNNTRNVLNASGNNHIPTNIPQSYHRLS